MWSNHGFQMPDGAQIAGRQGDDYHLTVSVPSDEQGFFGRQCPACDQLFRVDGEDYDAIPDDVWLWCVYCGHHDEHSEFITAQQRDRVMRAAADLGEQIIGQALDEVFGSFGRNSGRGSGFLKVTYRSEPFYPEPLPGIDEEKLVRVRQCGTCRLRYAVFGEHRYCPACGLLPPGVIALDALAAETARLDALAHLPADVVPSLREQGVFHRLWIDTLENLIGLVETQAKAVFHAVVPDAEDRLRGKGNIFQRLDETAELFVAAGHPDLRSVIDAPAWQRLLQTWAARHVFTHNDGVVDAKYLARVPASAARLGQRLTLTEQACRQAVADTEALCRALADLAV